MRNAIQKPRAERGEFDVAMPRLSEPNEPKAQKYAKYGGRWTPEKRIKMQTQVNKIGNTNKASASATVRTEAGVSAAAKLSGFSIWKTRLVA
ncbi:MAG: hypothetical protein QOD99_2172 [Chthoniobacter sp.]|nr:hypothetical protein [Chthoniobacter sp.]